MRKQVDYTILNAQGSAASGVAIPCEDFRHAIFFFATDGGSDAALTVKFQGSLGKGRAPDTRDVSPAFGSAQSVTNMWDYIEVIDLEDGSAIDGDTGVSVATADDYRMLEANINGLKYICATVTARTAGEVTVTVRLFND